MLTFGCSAVVSASIAIRSSTVNRLRLLLPASPATTTSSNGAAARATTSRVPARVGGSNEPGHTARVIRGER